MSLESVEAPLNEVVPGVFLGNLDAAFDEATFSSLGVRAVVNCTYEEPNMFEGREGVSYFRVRLFDDVHQALKIDRHLQPATQFIADAVAAGHPVLCHCRLGRSRSASVILAYLVRFHDMSLRKALMYLKTKRPTALPNHGFFKQLIDYEEFVRGKRSLTMGDLALCPFCSQPAVFSVRVACGHRACHRCFVRKLEGSFQARRDAAARQRRYATPRDTAGVTPGGEDTPTPDSGMTVGHGTVGGSETGYEDDDAFGGLLLDDEDANDSDGVSYGHEEWDAGAFGGGGRDAPSPRRRAVARATERATVAMAEDAMGDAEAAAAAVGGEPGAANGGAARPAAAGAEAAAAAGEAAEAEAEAVPKWVYLAVEEEVDVRAFSRRLSSLADELGMALYCPQCDYIRKQRELDRQPSTLDLEGTGYEDQDDDRWS